MKFKEKAQNDYICAKGFFRINCFSSNLLDDLLHQFFRYNQLWYYLIYQKSSEYVKVRQFQNEFM